MISAPRPAPIRINFRGLVQLLGICFLLTAATAGAWWYWQSSHAPMPAGLAAESERLPLLPVLAGQLPVVLGVALVEFVVLLALALSVSPPVWWLQIGDAPQRGPNAEATTPLMWLGQKIEQARTQNAQPPAQPDANQPVAQAGVYPAPPADQPEQFQPALALPGQPLPAQAPLPGQPESQWPVPQSGHVPPVPPNQAKQAGETGAGDRQVGQPNPDDAEAEVKPQDPNAPAVPQQSLQEALQFEEEEEEDVLAELGDVTSLISSAFNELDEVDPDLLALSTMLDPVDIHDLAQFSRRVTARFAAAPVLAGEPS